MVQKKYYPIVLILMATLLLTMGSCKVSKIPDVAITKDVRGPAKDYIKALKSFEPWAESVWNNYDKLLHSGYFGDGGSSGNGGIRGTCGIALSYAVLVHALPDDPRKAHRLKRIEEALHYAAQTHLSGPATVVASDGKKWGVTATSPSDDAKGWQSPLWAASLGFTAALVERRLKPEVVNECKRVVAAEADWQSKIPPATGFKGDTKAEENGWKSNILSLAAAWMPKNPHADKWLESAKLYLANTYTVPSDTLGSFKEWIKTQTLYPDYALENHGFYHPTYQMVAGMSLGDSYLMAGMLNDHVAKILRPFAEHNVLPVWQFMKPLVLDSGELAYPSGLDWSLHDFEHVSYFSWLASHFKDSVAEWAEPRLAAQILYRQSVNGDGRFVGESCPNCFYREAVEARRVAMAYLQDAMERFPTAKGAPPENGIFYYPNVKLIIQRSDQALTTISYGSRTMSLVYPLNGKNPAERFYVSPNTAILMGPEAKNKLISFQKQWDGFRATFLQERKDEKLRMIIDSKPGAVAYIKIPELDSNFTSEEWLLSAVEDDPLTGGTREILWKEDEKEVRGLSGISLHLVLSNWINVDNWMGYVVEPKGELLYQTAKDYNRNGGAEDYLYYKPKDTLIPHAVIVLSGKDRAATNRVSESVKWITDADGGQLIFQLPGQEKRAIKWKKFED